MKWHNTLAQHSSSSSTQQQQHAAAATAATRQTPADRDRKGDAQRTGVRVSHSGETCRRLDPTRSHRKPTAEEASLGGVAGPNGTAVRRSAGRLGVTARRADRQGCVPTIERVPVGWGAIGGVGQFDGGWWGRVLSAALGTRYSSSQPHRSISSSCCITKCVCGFNFHHTCALSLVSYLVTT